MAKKDNIPETKFSEAVVDFLIEIPMFDTIQSDELRIISRHMNIMDFKKGEVIFEEGDRGDYVCFIVK